MTNTLHEVTKALDRLRKMGPLTDADYLALVRLALGADPRMPNDEIPRRVAALVDQLRTSK